MKINTFVKASSIAIFRIWAIVFALIPYTLIILTSFLQTEPQHFLRWHFTVSAYQHIVSPVYQTVFFRSLLFSIVSTGICLVMAYPFSYFLSRMKNSFKWLLLLFAIIPLWTSALIRSYALLAILKAKGLLNAVLLSLGLIQTPLVLAYTNTAVMIGLVYNLLPFMILPLFLNMQRIDETVLEAARDLGADHFRLFKNIILPLTLPGIATGCLLVFLPAMTLFYIPDILGGARSMLLGNLLQDQILKTQNWPLGAAICTALMAIMSLFFIIYHRIGTKKQREQLL